MYTNEIRARLTEAEKYGNRPAAELARWQLAFVLNRSKKRRGIYEYAIRITWQNHSMGKDSQENLCAGARKWWRKRTGKPPRFSRHDAPARKL